MPKAKDLLNQRFNNLVVIEKTNKRSSNGSVYWKCKCDCGNEIEVISSSLISNNTKSCGCLNKNSIKKKGANALDLTNQKFGSLEALYPVYINNIRKWHCKCDCGNETDVITSKLRSGHTVSCGCARRKPKTKDEEMINKKFGRLLVLHRDENVNDSKSKWICKCDCGNITTVAQSDLVTGNTKSCGCFAKELSKNSIKNIAGWNLEDLTNQTFGKLKVLYKDTSRDNKTYWMCECECGNKISVRADALKSSHTSSCGCLKSLGENEVVKLLLANNIAFKQQYSFDGLEGNKNGKLRFDFFVNDEYLIEYDGIQHFKITSGWNDEDNFNKVKNYDEIKNQWCKENNIPLIRIPYTHLKELCIEDLLLNTTTFRVN